LFPGIDPDEVNRRLNAIKEQDVKLALIPEPKMKIGKIDSTGNCLITFNQKMLAPKEMDQKSFDRVFGLNLVNKTDGRIFKGFFQENEK
jgi:hypothetical protein